VPKDPPRADQAWVALEDLLPHPLISYRPGTPIGSRIAAAFQAAGLVKPVDIQTSLSSTACLLTAQGGGVALSDPFAVLTAEYPSLVVRAVRPRIAIGIDLLFSRDNPSSGIAMKLIEQVRMVAAEMAASVAQRTGLDAAHRPRPARGGRQPTTPRLAPASGSEKHLVHGV
jgi:DNA-binding transcriptional LysR family regulator